MKKLKKGNDPLKERRRKLLDKILKKYEDDVALKIVDKVKDNYLRRKFLD